MGDGASGVLDYNRAAAVLGGDSSPRSPAARKTEEYCEGGFALALGKAKRCFTQQLFPVLSTLGTNFHYPFDTLHDSQNVEVGGLPLGSIRPSRGTKKRAADSISGAVDPVRY